MSKSIPLLNQSATEELGWLRIVSINSYCVIDLRLQILT